MKVNTAACEFALSIKGVIDTPEPTDDGLSTEQSLTINESFHRNARTHSRDLITKFIRLQGDVADSNVILYEYSLTYLFI